MSSKKRYGGPTAGDRVEAICVARHQVTGNAWRNAGAPGSGQAGRRCSYRGDSAARRRGEESRRQAGPAEGRGDAICSTTWPRRKTRSNCGSADAELQKLVQIKISLRSVGTVMDHDRWSSASHLLDVRSKNGFEGRPAVQEFSIWGAGRCCRARTNVVSSGFIPQIGRLGVRAGEHPVRGLGGRSQGPTAGRSGLQDIKRASQQGAVRGDSDRGRDRRNRRDMD